MSCKTWQDVDNWFCDCNVISFQGRSDVIPLPYVISDTTEPLQHPLTGKFYTSRREFSRITRENGYEEVGNDPNRLNPKPKPKPNRTEIRQSIQKAAARYKNGERVNF